MLSTLPDYVRFTRMLAGGGEVDGVRVLAPRTLRLMTTNHLSADLGTLSTGGFTATSFDGLGFAVVEDPVKSRSASSPGEYYWGGAAGTVFRVDPTTQLLDVTGSQLVTSEAHPIRAHLRRLVHSDSCSNHG